MRPAAAGAATPLTGRTSSRVDKYGLLARPRFEKTDVIILAQPVDPPDGNWEFTIADDDLSSTVCDDYTVNCSSVKPGRNTCRMKL